ncbi:MAG TPA: alpha-galactosidase [Verrucomicrobiae bacterium]
MLQARIWFAIIAGIVTQINIFGAALDRLPVIHPEYARTPEADWLITPSKRRAEIFRSADAPEIVMNNGFISRAWRIAPNAACVTFDNLMTDQTVIRGVKPEAVIEIDNVKYSVGGLSGQRNYAYLRTEWLDTMTNDTRTFQFTGFEIGAPQKRLEWKRKSYSSDAPWPPPGVALTLNFSAPLAPSSATNNVDSVRDVSVSVHYEMYDGIPLLSKWITISNAGPRAITLNTFTSEILAAVEYESVVDKRERWEYPNIHVQSDYSFRGMDIQTANQTTHWVIDPQYRTQVSSSSTTPNMLESRPPIGPGAVIEPGKTFESFHTFELIHDSTDRERKGLAIRQMYRHIAPWVTENPIMMHVRSADPKAVRLAIDQCAEVGFEMVIISFWSGFDMENEDPAYLAQYKELADYAHSKGVELGAYSLLASRSINPNEDVIDPTTGKPGGNFGSSPCIGSKWGQNYFRKLYAFYEKTGMDLLEHDGSYPGDVCASTNHPGHHGLADSQWTQWTTITDFYKWCRARGIYLNVPDLYFLDGSTKCGMGYRESNWGLPRAEQLIHARQNIFDGTWEKTPSMGWMLVPLTEYGGGGPAATIEPLAQHLDHYNLTLANNFGAGVQACYRGPRLYDTDETKALVKKWTAFYKKHRAILDSDLIHTRRPDARDVDFYLHVNPQLEEKALIMAFNPLDGPTEKILNVPLYYTGKSKQVTITDEHNHSKKYALDQTQSAKLPVQLPPQSVTWFIVR